MDIRRVEIQIEANDPGSVFDVAKRLRDKGFPGRPRVVPNRETRVIAVEGASLRDVDRAMERYVAGYAKGHGGYRFKYRTKETLVSEKETIEEEVTARFERKIELLRQEHAALEEKWGAERKAYKDRIREAEGTLAVERLRLEDAREIARTRLGELIEAQKENSDLQRQAGGLQGELADLRSRTLRQILGSRLRALFSRSRANRGGPRPTVAVGAANGKPR